MSASATMEIRRSRDYFLDCLFDQAKICVLDVVCEMEPSIPILISLHWATLRWPVRCNPFLVEPINNYICISQDEFIPPDVYDEYYLIITRSKARANESNPNPIESSSLLAHAHPLTRSPFNFCLLAHEKITR
jgi:hypothetical protein